MSLVVPIMRTTLPNLHKCSKMASEEETVYCLCRRTYEEDQFMIECEVCKDWFHGSCVGIKEHQAADIEIYHCPNCQITHGPLVLKRRRNWHRRDYSENDENITKAVQTGTVVFIRKLKHRTFPSADEVPVKRLRGYELTKEYLEENGFDVPILVEKKDGLDLKVPPPSFTIQDVENHVGSMREIAVIDVAMQEDYKMLMREWTEYYNSPNRTKIYNVISLEFTNTKLADLVEPPRIVKELSWVSQYWPEDQPPEDVMFQRPEVQRYCLMGVKDSFTDFHIDFGGTSVWYHVLKGEKVFYLIRPTVANLALYETWLASSNQSEMFFGDQVDTCYKCVVKQGQTLFIPTGWIHAVLTPIDSLVFGGNFLHSLNIELQIKVYEIEKRVETESKYLFPNYETVHWYAAKHILDIMKEHREEGSKVPEYLINGARCLAAALKLWTHKKDLNSRYIYIKKDSIPETIQYGRLLKELNKEIKAVADKAKDKKRGARRSKGSDGDDMFKSPKSETKAVEGGLIQSPRKGCKKAKQTKGLSAIKDENLTDLASPTGCSSPQSPTFTSKGLKPAASLQNTFGIGLAKLKKNKEDEKKLKESKAAAGDQLTMRIPKFGAYQDASIYDFNDDNDDGAPAKLEHRRTSNPTGSPNKTKAISPYTKDDKKPAEKSDAEQENAAQMGLKLKVSAGKINSGQTSEGNQKPDSFALGHEKSDTSDNEDELVVDETPKKPVRNKIFGLPVIDSGKVSQDSDEADLNKSEDSYIERLNMPTIRGGLNGSISDILEASGYGTETDFKTDDDINRASPTMRDAIQGMLSMSRIGMRSTLVTSSSSSEKTRLGSQRRLSKSTESSDKMPTCYKDDEFVYPTLDLSDHESDHVFKPRGRPHKDETWNPKAKLSPNCPKPERPHREGVGREAVQSGLAAAAAKYAHLPPPKRQYVRRKHKQEKKPSSDTQASTSSGLGHELEMSLGGAKRHGSQSSPIKAKKPKKGMATAKQRLGKILKLHKMMM